MSPQQILVELQWATYVDHGVCCHSSVIKVLLSFCSVCLCTIKRKLINTNGKNCFNIWCHVYLKPAYFKES